MALNFPSSPSANDEYTYSNKTWVYTGSAWRLKDTGSVNEVVIGDTLSNVNWFASNSTLTINTTVISLSQTFNYANSTIPGLITIIDSVSNTAANIAASANSVKIAYDAAGDAYTNATAYADSVANTAYVNATSYASNADNISSGTLNTDRLPATVNVSTQINVGANVVANVTSIKIGNGTTNTIIEKNSIKVGNSTVNATISTTELNISNVTTTSFTTTTITANGSSGNVGQVLTSGGSNTVYWSNVAGGGGYKSVSVISSNTQANIGGLYVLANTVTLTLPLTPAAGDVVTVSNRSNTTNCIINRNGEKIMGESENLVVNVINSAFNLVYVDTNEGWILI